MYRLLGDWMRGTYPVAPTVALQAEREDMGGRQFSLFYLSGHTSSDLVIRDDDTGVVFAGDLAFLYRAPTTPHADVVHWKDSLDVLSGMDKSLLVPGHGPSDAKDESLVQTADYLDWLYGSVSDAVQRGLTMNEAMALLEAHATAGQKKGGGPVEEMQEEFGKPVAEIKRDGEDKATVRFEGQETPKILLRRLAGRWYLCLEQPGG